jgi:hypothetical protein
MLHGREIPGIREHSTSGTPRERKEKYLIKLKGSLKGLA